MRWTTLQQERGQAVPEFTIFLGLLHLYPSNKGILKLTCTLKGEVPQKWPLNEDAPVAINRNLRMWKKFSIISSLCRVRACSSNRLIGSSSSSILFSSAIEGFLGVRERLSSRETSSRPNLLYSDLVGDMHRKNDQEQPALIPLIRIIFGTK